MARKVIFRGKKRERIALSPILNIAYYAIMKYLADFEPIYSPQTDD